MTINVNWMRVVSGSTSGKYAVELSNDEGVWANASGWLDAESGATAFAESHYSTVTATTASVSVATLLDLDERVVLGHYTDKTGDGGYVPVVGE